MASNRREYDIVVFGASGYTGKYIIEEIALYHPEVRWCVAGRSHEKLSNTLKEVGKLIGKDLNNIGILEAEAGNEESLANMCKSSALLINCVGPFRFTGEKIVEQCVKYGTHHVDISGEPQFLETIQLKYFEKAKAEGIYVVGSCGFDSLPADLGTEVTKRVFDGDVNFVETFFLTNVLSTVNFATWQSAVHGFANSSELKPLRKALKETIFMKPLPRPEYKLNARPKLSYSQEVNGFCVPFYGSDKSVISRTQMFNYQFKNERPAQIQAYYRPPNFIQLFGTLFVFFMFLFFSSFAFGRYLLEKFPGFFSLGLFRKSPPLREEVEKGSFKLLFKAVGWSEKLLDPSDRHSVPPNKTVIAEINGPEPGYFSTAICVVNSAMVMLFERDKLPLNGGVFTPGAAFIDTSIMKRLEERGLTFKFDKQ